MKTLTQTQQIKQQHQTVKERIQRVLKWDDLQFGKFQYNMGHRYLVNEFGDDCPMIDVLLKQRIFWSWWINHWVRRDEAFLHQFEGTGRNDLDLAYKLRHNPQAVVFKPQSTILRYSYAEMMGKMIDQVQHD